MNRQKKIQDIYSKRLKKAKAKRNPSSKPKYISKAERAKLELSTQADSDTTADNSVTDTKV